MYTKVSKLINGRKYIGFEINKEYCETIKSRLETTFKEIKNENNK